MIKYLYSIIFVKSTSPKLAINKVYRWDWMCYEFKASSFGKWDEMNDAIKFFCERYERYKDYNIQNNISPILIQYHFSKNKNYINLDRIYEKNLEKLLILI